MPTHNLVRTRTQERRRRLVERLAAPDPVDVASLATSMGVSDATIRRDLAELEKAGQILRVLGGAVGRRAGTSWHDKERHNADAKLRIAAEAVALVPAGAMVFLDAGTTTAAVATLLATRADLTLATIGLPSLFNIADGSASVIVIGGQLNQRGGRFSGGLTRRMLDLIGPDVAFLGADSVDPVRGLNCPDPDIAELKTHVVEIARTSWVLLDRSKLDGQPRNPYWAPIPPSVGFLIEPPTAAQQPLVDALAARGHPIHLA